MDHVVNIGAYVIKYMIKEDADPQLIGKKMYQETWRTKELVWEQAGFIFKNQAYF
ncbi:hypothetical protein J7I93_09350 [Bacillus sp. ISL-47]|uniref:hypothetical protein n=1 Tax=Bacillus sp. ISL-47 TaxID=2819130 RepID=UPI001BE75F88|nr:hypothetical protein [Bacillus sp. ISL-47]MBT2688386.1 hypothetical protein [Bacillus sp. ISL-47]MBT2710501.1 hypothetical protein [Pseudomonas sp. ISL-84]